MDNFIRKPRKSGRFYVDNEFIDYISPKLTTSANLVYFYLCRRANKEQFCYPSIKRMTQDLSLSESTVFRAIKQLDDTHLIVRYRKGKKLTNRYYLVDKLEWHKDSDLSKVKYHYCQKRGITPVKSEVSIVRKLNSKVTKSKVTNRDKTKLVDKLTFPV